MALESLTLEGCSFIGELTIKNSKKFRTLLISGYVDIILITIDYPNINTFYYDGAINKIKFVEPIRLKDVISFTYMLKPRSSTKIQYHIL